MPRVDGRTGDIVIRIVYDGMPEAGKTTNIHQLFGAIPLQRRGALASPDTKGRRTEFFDWLDFAGGFVDGRRLRCQLVSVPGQPQLLHRRKYLLESADAVVFVADSQPASVEENRECITKLLELLASFASELAAPIVVQANKQDLGGAMRPRALKEVLAVPIATPVVPAVAQAGRGVMDTFVLAARLASDRVRALVLEGAALDALGDVDESATSLHSAMLALETRPGAPGGDDDRPTERVPQGAPADSIERARPNDVEAARGCQLPRPELLLAGHVWPPVKGRAAMAAAAVGEVQIPERALDWAPPEPIEIGLEPGWVLHSSARWHFATESEARLELMARVRAVAASPELVPEGRALMVGADDAGFRLWVLTPTGPSLAVALTEALARGDAKEVAAVRAAVRAGAEALAGARGSTEVLGGAAGVALRGGRMVLLAMGEGGEPISDHAERLARRFEAKGERE